jgi:hypothetical protein
MNTVTDLVVREPETDHAALERDSGALIARIEARGEQLPGLIKAGDTASIKRLRDNGEAAALAAKKLGYLREARALSQHAVQCDAALGVISGRAGGPSRGDSLLTAQRAVGAAMARGRLGEVFDKCDRYLEIMVAAQAARDIGATGVPRSYLAKQIRKRAAERRISVSELGRQSGVGVQAIHSLVSGSKRHEQNGVVSWWHAYRAMSVLGIDLSKAPLARRRRSRRSGSPVAKWISHTFRPGMGKWDEVGVRYTKMRDEMRRADPMWTEKPAVYEAMKNLSDIIQREIRAAEK